jgi:hypothetical protein
MLIMSGEDLAEECGIPPFGNPIWAKWGLSKNAFFMNGFIWRWEPEWYW